MSLSFNDTSNQDGILQRIEQELGFSEDYITGDTTRRTQWAGSINLALDKVFHIIFGADGRWQFDDSNHTTYPILTGNLVDGQRDYSFTEDSDGNLVLDIYRVFVRMSSTAPYYEIFPRDVQSDAEGEISGFIDGLNTEGRPQTYDKTATGIFIDPIPNANSTAGLKIYVNREGSYFTSSDVTAQTKIPGFAGLYHLYCVYEPAYQYAMANNLSNREVLDREVQRLELDITEYYSRRSRDERTVMFGEPIFYE